MSILEGDAVLKCVIVLGPVAVLLCILLLTYLDLQICKPSGTKCGGEGWVGHG